MRPSRVALQAVPLTLARCLQMTLVYVATVTPFVVAFTSGYPFKSPLGIVDLAINVFYLVDIVLYFRTAIAKDSDLVGSQVGTGLWSPSAGPSAHRTVARPNRWSR